MPAKKEDPGFFKKALNAAGNSLSDVANYVGENVLSSPAYKKGGMMKEGSAKDTREDKVKAKKAGMTMAKWESSAADKKHDSGMKRGGKVEKKATGGSVRGAGCATRGKGFAGTF